MKTEQLEIMDREKFEIMDVAMQHAKALGRYEGTCKYVFENIDTLTKQEINSLFKRVYNETSSL
jgi:methyl coenzyme M reductase beta subunit